MIVAGYSLAVIVTFGVVAIYVMLTSGPDRDASSGMYAFGDLLLFLTLFGGLSFVPTGIALFLMRRSKIFWSICSVVALSIAAVCLISEIVWYVHWITRPTDLKTFTFWEALTIPVMFCSPFLFLTFGGAALAATRIFKWLLGSAAVLEGLCCVGFIAWFAKLVVATR